MIYNYIRGFDKESILSQRLENERYIKGKFNISTISPIYTDTTDSLSNPFERESFKQMIEDIEQNKEEESIIVMYHPDRLTRNRENMLNTMNELNKRNIRVIFAKNINSF